MFVKKCLHKVNVKWDNKVMETFETYSLIGQKKWTAFLTSLEFGEHSFCLPSIAAIKSCKAVAYSLNTDGLGRRYSISADKATKKVTIAIKEV